MNWDAFDTGVDVLGAALDRGPLQREVQKNPASDYGAEYGPLSPDQLAQLDRRLTPAEQAAVSEWQSKQADVQLATERAKGGPQSATVAVTSKGAIISRPKTAADDEGRPWWQWLLLAVGVTAIGAGGYEMLRRKRKR